MVLSLSSCTLRPGGLNTNHVVWYTLSPMSLPFPGGSCYVFFDGGLSVKSEVRILPSQILTCWKKANFWEKNPKRTWRAETSWLNFLCKVHEFMGNEPKNATVGSEGWLKGTLNPLSCEVTKAFYSARKNKVAPLLGWVSSVLGIWSWDLWCLFCPVFPLCRQYMLSTLVISHLRPEYEVQLANPICSY